MPGVIRPAGPKRLAAQWQVDLGDYVTALAWSPDGQHLAAAASNGPVSILAADTGTHVHRLSGHPFGTLAVAWSPDGQRLATGGQDGKARIWDPATGAELAALDGGAAWVEHLAWSPAGDTLASAAGKQLRLWQADGALLQSPPPHPSTVAGVQWPAGGPGLISICYGGVRVWPDGVASASSSTASSPFGEGGRAAGKLYAWKGSLIALRCSPDGRHVACGSQETSVHVWNLRTEKDLEMAGYQVKVRELAWDCTSRFLATGGSPDVVVWNFGGKGPAGSKPLELSAHADLITDMAFQHRGPLLATGGQDGVLFFWSVPDSRYPLALAQHTDPVSKLAWRPGDRAVAAGYASGLVSAWPDPGK